MPGGSHYAAVSVVLDPGARRVLIVKRTESPGDPWSGDWALPGGRMEPSDADLRQTAIRETMEETGIRLDSDAEQLLELDFFSPSNAPWILVKPFVFRLLRDVEVRLSGELARYAWVPLEGLRASRDATGRPEFLLEDGERIWGMTARILLEVKARLGAP
ncbi:MAG: CoA pyrophosphatase [Nitrososphaeria archaeon]